MKMQEIIPFTLYEICMITYYEVFFIQLNEGMRFSSLHT